MYDELVRQMRACCNGEPCEEANCCFNPKSDLDCIEQLLTKAADAIEELAKDKEFLNFYGTQFSLMRWNSIWLCIERKPFRQSHRRRKTMEIEVKKTVNVPVSPWCGNCYRKEKDSKGQDFCTLHDRFLFIHKGHFLKCRECYMALYDVLERES